MEIGLYLGFIQLWSIAIELCFILISKIIQIFTNGSDFWSKPKMSGFLQNNVRDPRSQELCIVGFIVLNSNPLVDQIA